MQKAVLHVCCRCQLPPRNPGECYGELLGADWLAGSRTNQAAQVRLSLDWLLQSGNEPGPAGAKAVAQPGSRHAIIFNVSLEPGWPDAEATVHRQAADVDACNQSQSPASLVVQKRKSNNMMLHLEGLADASLYRRCEPGMPGKTTNQPLNCSRTWFVSAGIIRTNKWRCMFASNR
jgi:hypothetical protein